MEKSEKRRPKRSPIHQNSLIAKCRNEEEEDKEAYWRQSRRGRELPQAHDRSDRRQSNPPIPDPRTSYERPNSYELRRQHPAPSRTKYLVPSVLQETCQPDSKSYGILRALRKQFYPRNVAIVRKNRYKDEPNVQEEAKYVDEDLAVDDNCGEETGEDVVEEERESVAEYSDKEYEEQEADDEVDEESDVLERPVDRPRTQRKSCAESSSKNQRSLASVEPSHRHRALKSAGEKEMERCCHTIAEPDYVDALTDEEEEQKCCDSTTCHLKKSMWRYQLPQQNRESRNLPRNLVERHSRTSSGSAQQSRRSRTTKPDVESSMTSTRPTHPTIRNYGCSYCTVPSGPTTKTTSSRNAGCRIQDGRYFSRVPIGDEGEGFEDPEPAAAPYRTKPRRSKDSRSPTYDPREEARTMDAELGALYKSSRSKNPRDLSNGLGERTRHSLRARNRHEASYSKIDNRSWS